MEAKTQAQAPNQEIVAVKGIIDFAPKSQEGGVKKSSTVTKVTRHKARSL